MFLTLHRTSFMTRQWQRQFFRVMKISQFAILMLETDKSLFEIVLRHRHDPEGISTQYTMLAVIRGKRH